ncbi:MAG: DNA adenine methylase [Planctomycetota bacterium]
MNGPHHIPHPIPYQGSKRLIAPTILAYCPRSLTRLVEPFAGSAALSLAAAFRRQAESFWLNDAHSPLVKLWREILTRPDALADAYANLWDSQQGRERAFFDEVRARFNRKHDPADFLYLLARCVKAAIRYNSAGEFNNTPDNRRLGARPAEMRRRILGAAELLAESTRLTAQDYTRVLADCDNRDLIYMDPPYQGVCGDRDQRYAPKLIHDQFCSELEFLNSRGVMYVVSYDGRTGEKRYGAPLPAELKLLHLEIRVGRSTQATLLGRDSVTYESLYLSPALRRRLPKHVKSAQQLELAFG